jgi:N-acyl-D-amino-acid deacylase
VDVLLQAGARGKSDPAPELRYVNNNTIASAVARSMPVLQKSALQFVKKSGCVSCHHNSLTERTVAVVSKKGFAVDANLDQQEMQAVTAVIDANREQLLQGVMSLGGGATTLGYILIAFDAQHRPPSQATDAMVRHLKLTQQPDGRWTSVHRPPSESSEFTAAAVSLRGLQLYAPKDAGYDKAIRAAAGWLTNARPATTEDRVFRVFGLAWSRANKGVLQNAVQELIREQRSDGGWAQLPTLKSDAYATGSALVALNEAGVSVKAPVYQRGVRFLLNSQLEDGSWLVRTRSRPVQPYFESGFPHGMHQWISTNATNWAVTALAIAR